MHVVTFDTHKAVEYLIKKGVKKEQAEGIVETLQQSREIDFNQLVTKDYLDARLGALETKFDAKLDSKFAKIKSDLLVWMIGSYATATATIIGFLIYLK